MEKNCSHQLEKMNFIDKAFEQNLKGDDFLQAMADIYSEPEVYKELKKYPRFVADIITVIDYDTALQMDGLDDGSYDKEYNNLSSRLALNNDYDGFWDMIRAYIDRNLS